ncbi:TPA: malonate decarboxylase holo-[acyl-carrier-protein] synthase [Stenotrophomonas maltophilia]|uniref:malonate decarboxylase holo-[acyl-carrier-protein] synthase n=1 Tax=Stenotrophomonas maltophilia TaxID=40324 RepID=UPI0015DD6E6C|nr:malonate decarboxylase holo-[acyl-carrier-protein] synthase [Stenotrophomonas maltophilia]MBA0446054.1 malonate decarboxylase holo-[acyl-carrier-protein] synthase [Stenotrophomonas maltophilia]HEL2980964.1 malonate decarboxylase holo-[acyl-carrier-protein] synthase [Stenotrophomonas maltophilia]
MPEQPARHTLAWLSANADWRADVAAQEPRLAAWFAQGLPAMVARRAADDPDPRLRLGVPLPPNEGKLRLALRVPLQDVQRLQLPPALDAVLTTGVPTDWQRALRAVARIAPARVFGAFAWQHLSGLPYVHARSDIDLLWQVESRTQADALAAHLNAWEHEHARRVDGELCLPDGGAVNWREFAGDSRQVLVKRLEGAALHVRERLFEANGVVA